MSDISTASAVVSSLSPADQARAEVAGRTDARIYGAGKTAAELRLDAAEMASPSEDSTPWQLAYFAAAGDEFLKLTNEREVTA